MLMIVSHSGVFVHHRLCRMVQMSLLEVRLMLSGVTALEQDLV